ncbi:MAG: FAD-dependent oxidoreductase [bacterium]
MLIKKTSANISKISDLTKTCKELELTLSEPIDFIAGNFVNIFLDINGEKVRRAYSISSSDKHNQSISIAIRLKPDGKVTPIFWNEVLLNTKIEVMGPLGINTADKMTHPKVFLFAYGVGAGVVKSIADHLTNTKDLVELIIMTGSRFEDEIIYKDYFDQLTETNPKVKVFHIVSRPQENSIFKKGYIQDYITDLDFNNSDVYICGQKSACDQLAEAIKKTQPSDCAFFVEAF